MPEVRTGHHTTNIDGYRVELELYTESGEPRSDCSVHKGNFSSSLSRLENEGTLYHNTDRCDDIEVHPRTVERIRTWAEDLGY